MSATESHPSALLPGVATYRAAVVHDFASPLALDDVPRLGLEPGQVRVQVEASGLCHTDIHAAHNIHGTTIQSINLCKDGGLARRFIKRPIAMNASSRTDPIKPFDATR